MDKFARRALQELIYAVQLFDLVTVSNSNILLPDFRFVIRNNIEFKLEN